MFHARRVVCVCVGGGGGVLLSMYTQSWIHTRSMWGGGGGGGGGEKKKKKRKKRSSRSEFSSWVTANYETLVYTFCRSQLVKTHCVSYFTVIHSNLVFMSFMCQPPLGTLTVIFLSSRVSSNILGTRLVSILCYTCKTIVAEEERQRKWVFSWKQSMAHSGFGNTNGRRKSGKLENENRLVGLLFSTEQDLSPRSKTQNSLANTKFLFKKNVVSNTIPTEHQVVC